MDFGHPPPTMGNMGPPPGMGMGPPMGPPPHRNNMRHNFRPYNSYQMRFPPQGPLNMTQDDFDGKRLRKSVMRKTVDYNAAIIKELECRVWQRDWRDRHALQPDAMYTPDLLPPPSYPDNPINAVTTRFVKTATNKMRCPIFAVAWTPEGRRLITGASSGEFTLWNGLTFNFETILQAHDSPVRSMVWSHGEGWMVTGDHSGFIKYWQSNMNNVKMYQAHKEAVRGISFSPSDSKIVTCSDDGTLRIFDFYRCQEERILRGHGADVKCVQWHPTKALIVSGSKDNQQPIKLWDPKSGTALATLHAHKSTVMDLKWNDNGNWLITASRDHLLKLFDIRKLNTELQIFRGHKKEASSVVWHPTHEGLFCSGGSDGAILFWNVGTDKEVGCIEGAHESIVWTMAWHPLGHILCSGSNDHTCKFWTRNRPGDLMRDKYNLNTLPPGVQDDHDLEEPAIIPGMGPEDKVEIFSSDTDKVIPGLDLDTTLIPMDFEKKVKKVPYSKPIPRNFQAQWNHGPVGEDNPEPFSNTPVESMPGAVPLNQISASAIFIYGKLIPVEPGSQLEKAISEGSVALKKYIAAGELEELKDVMPHLEDDAEEDDFQPFEYSHEDEEPVKDEDNYDHYNDYYDPDMDTDVPNNKPPGPNDFNNGPADVNNKGPPVSNMGPPSANMGPPVGNMGPHMGNKAPMRPPMGNMGPIRPNMGPGAGGSPMRNMGPMMGPPMRQMGPGPRGPGPMGNRGPGPMGQGPMGNMGSRPMGHMGPGPIGNMGHGPRGNMGPSMGNMGPPGSMGPSGNMGPPGNIGPTGGMGPPGNIGQHGPRGNNMGPPMGNMGPPMSNMQGPPMGNMQGPPMGNMQGPPIGNMGPPMSNMQGPPMGNMQGPPMGNMQGPRPPFNDNGYNKPHYDSGFDNNQYQQNDVEYNDEENYDQGYNEDENHFNNDNSEEGNNADGRGRWEGGYRERGGPARGRGRGINGHGSPRGMRRGGARGSPRGRARSGGRGFRRGMLSN